MFGISDFAISVQTKPFNRGGIRKLADGIFYSLLRAILLKDVA